jgi:SAM-dependent methyltransferase
MTRFGAYARYYDLLYRDKDYAAEAAFVHSVLQRHGISHGRLLELGSGTGKHARELALLGHAVHGIDLSEAMLLDAQAIASSADVAGRLSFERGDARSFRAGRTFDAVISLFHVMSYQTSNDELLAACNTAGAHLGPGGVFLFDFWYGPTVLTDRPEHRERVLEDAETRIVRIADPVMRPNDNVCEVHYRMAVESKSTGDVEHIEEVHEMRYLFLPELDLLLEDAGFDRVEAFQFGTQADLGFDTWDGCVVARKR